MVGGGKGGVITLLNPPSPLPRSRVLEGVGEGYGRGRIGGRERSRGK